MHASFYILMSITSTPNILFVVPFVLIFTISKRVVVLGAMGVITMLLIFKHAQSFCNLSLFAI